MDEIKLIIKSLEKPKINNTDYKFILVDETDYAPGKDKSKILGLYAMENCKPKILHRAIAEKNSIPLEKVMGGAHYSVNKKSIFKKKDLVLLVQLWSEQFGSTPRIISEMVSEKIGEYLEDKYGFNIPVKMTATGHQFTKEQKERWRKFLNN